VPATWVDRPQLVQIAVNLIAGAFGVIAAAAVHLTLSRGNHTELPPTPVDGVLADPIG
jgi:hypothetical protein